jgi:hypothetical protein
VNLFLSQDGVPVEALPENDSTYFYRDPQGSWLPVSGHALYEIDSLCVQIHDAMAGKIFDGIDNYHRFLYLAPEFLSTAGMNSESLASRETFEKFLARLEDDPQINRGLYLYDCRKLVSGVQECSIEVVQLQGEFYRILNLEELFFPPIDEPDGIRYVTSPVVTSIHAILAFIFVRLHSLLDYMTKLAIEVENMRDKFVRYPRLASRNALYGDRGRVSFNGEAGTLFEQCALITEVETIRNHVIHDGLLDDMPKVYKVVADGKCVEKFVLFPDRTPEGRFTAFRNRNLFYSKEDKINFRLPSLVREFEQRVLVTLDRLLTQLEPEKSI